MSDDVWVRDEHGDWWVFKIIAEQPMPVAAAPTQPQ